MRARTRKAGEVRRPARMIHGGERHMGQILRKHLNFPLTNDCMHRACTTMSARKLLSSADAAGPGWQNAGLDVLYIWTSCGFLNFYIRRG